MAGLTVHIDIPISKGHGKEFERRKEQAQFWLDSQIMTDMVPLMPHYTGTFINVTRAQSASLAGSGIIVAATAPMGRFLYEGKVMIDPVTKSPWARPHAKKVVTDRNLDFFAPGARAHWFDVAKQNHLKEWIKGVKDIMGGKNG